jgi:hypothetical protein
VEIGSSRQGPEGEKRWSAQRAMQCGTLTVKREIRKYTAGHAESNEDKV